MTVDLLIVGSGGFSREAAQLVHAINDVRSTWRLLGFLDDDPGLKGATVDGLPVLGGAETVHEHPGAHVVIGVGNPRAYAARRRIARRLGLPAERYATLVHPTAVVSRDSMIGPGTVITAHCVLTAAVRVGAHVVVSPHVVLTHDDVIGDYVTFAAGVRVAGGARIEDGAYIGSGALIREYLTIGAWSLIGMGSGVTRDVPPHEIWAGTPARYLRAADITPEDVK